ncbi:ATP-binding cassette domain-containing protein [Candidatus Bathyarchaeota archaeon]|nr:ATP-binding cassette domain-containing protein [Candidatus Bathyarchaeota archaeon]
MRVIEAHNLSFTYAGSKRPAILDVNLGVDKGEFVVLTGPSGCGKTTFARCLNGLIPNFYQGELSGSITIMGTDISGHTTSELSRKVGFVFQNPENQLFSLSIERDVAFGPENLGLPKEETRRRVDWAMEITGISELREAAPYELSGGQQQRAAIAAVLAMKPEIMVLDEPTSFLDPLSASQILEAVADLREEANMTIVLIEHRLDLASKYASRIVVMDQGRVVLDGPPAKVYGEEAKLIGVGIPKISMLFNLLRQDGFDMGETPVSVEEATERLRSYLKDDRG